MMLKKCASVLSLGLLSAAVGLSAPSFAAGDTPVDGVAQVFDQSITNIPGKSLIAVEVDYAPGEKSPAHRHADSAFIMAYVLSGAIRSQVEGEPAHVYRAGQTWHEEPGAHHLVSENASETEPARLLAVFVVDTADKALTTFDD